MNITLDHNCIIDLADRTAVGAQVSSIVSDSDHHCFVVNIGASEMREKGVRPDRYERFEELLESAGLARLPRLNPIGIYGVTFWGRCLYADGPMINLASRIDIALFGDIAKKVVPIGGLESPAGRRWLNRQCDVHTMWCHIRNSNDVFLTSDSNFMKATKLPKLLELGAKRICSPNEL